MNEKYSGPIKHYVINLDRSTKRLEHISNQFKKLNLSFERVSAVDARCLTAEDLAFYQPDLGRIPPLRDTEIACFLSHRRCWQFIADGEEQIATIFEDDIYLSHLFVNFLTLRPWRKDIQLLSLEKPTKPLRANLVYEEGDFQTYRVFNFNVGGGGYLLTKAHAQFLLEHTQHFYWPVDSLLFDPRCLMSQLPNFYSHQISPALCVQSCNDADICAKYGFLPTQQTVIRHFSKQACKKRNAPRSFLQKIKRFIRYIAHQVRGRTTNINYIE